MTEEVLSVDRLKETGFLHAGDVYFARLCAGTWGQRPAAGDVPLSSKQAIQELIFALVSRYLREGHPCIPLSALAGLEILDPGGVSLGQLPSQELLEQALQGASALTRVRWGETPVALTSPLVCDPASRLYVARYFEHEQRLAQALARIVRSTDVSENVAPVAPGFLQEKLEHYFPASQVNGSLDLQRAAAAIALTSRLAVISGGPGTGKTSTVVKILALLAEEAQSRGASAPLVRLLAPTGKAAARMMEAIRAAGVALDLPEGLREGWAEATTIHRALGVIPGNPTRFRHGKEHPLRADVVLVDEASMVDLALMRHLIESLPRGAHLILLGDRHQLASVEAGSVLAELCSELSKEEGTTVELTRSYRFAEESGIAELATCVRVGDAKGCVKVLGSERSDLVWEGHAREPAQSSQLRSLVVHAYQKALSAGGPGEILAAMAEFRVLCAHRRGPYGVERVNEAVHKWLIAAGALPPTAPSGGREGLSSEGGTFYRGRLILITENDYGLGLSNGDTGLVWPDDDGKMSVFFQIEGAGIRRLSPAQLPAHETAFAATVHKSQGSEYGEVAVVLPEATSPLLTRELLYTAMTRARRRVHLFASEGSIRAAVERTVTRHSGLGDALGRALARPASKDLSR